MLRSIVSLVVSALIISWAAIYNGYPFVFPDTGVYLEQALLFSGEASRPPYYSLFVLPLHLSLTLWPIVLVQGLIVAFLIRLIIRSVLGSEQIERRLMLTALLLAVGTSLPWHAGQIMPDVFAGVLILALYLIVVAWSDCNKLERAAVFVILTMAMLFHYSHLLVAVLTLSIATVAIFWSEGYLPKWRQKAIVLGMACVITVGGFVAYNKFYADSATLSVDSSKFVLARMVHDGTVQAYLADVCGEQDFVLCKYRDILKPGYNLLWGEESIWWELEAELGFLGAREEASEIVLGIMASNADSVVYSAMGNFFRQLRTFESADRCCKPFLGGTKVNEVMERFFPSEYDDFAASRQNSGRLNLDLLRDFHRAVVVVSLIMCLVALALMKSREDMAPGRFARAKHLLLFAFIGVISNAAVTGILSGAANRYQSRVIWVVVLVTIIVWLVLRRTDRTFAR
jgi:hypothetical protein